jgi:hypothetical protein
VGLAESILDHKFGAEIDQHDTVIRIGYAPTTVGAPGCVQVGFQQFTHSACQKRLVSKFAFYKRVHLCRYAAEYAEHVGTRTDVVLARMNSKNKDCRLDNDVWQLHSDVAAKSKLKGFILFAEHGKSQFPVPVSLQATQHGCKVEKNKDFGGRGWYISCSGLVISLSHTHYSPRYYAVKKTS